jgi:hypothetical protein
MAVERLRWPSGYACPRCARRDSPFRSGLLMGCPRCGFMDALTSHTLFHGTAKPLSRWFGLLWDTAGQRFGTSVVRVQRLLAAGDRAMAWEYLKRVQHAMGRASGERLRGSVEVARCTVESPGHRQAWTGPAVVVVAAERGSGGLGRIRLQHLRSVTATAVTEFVGRAVEPGSAVLTGPWQGYAQLANARLVHSVQTGRARPGGRPIGLARAQAAAHTLRRWLWSTPGVTPEQLGSYLNEFAFRFPRRGCSRGMLFYHLLRAAVPADRPVRSPWAEPARFAAG